MKRLVVLGVAAAFTAAACTTYDQYGNPTPNRTATGALLGAGAGALLGTLAGGDDRRNALVGAGVGALAGGLVGNYMDRQAAALEAELAGSGVGVSRQGENILLSLPSDISFQAGSYQLEPRFYPVLDDIGRTLVDYPQTYVDVIGHASADGDAGYNQRLSENRASNVAQYLISRGVMRERMYVAGRGETQPVADNATAEGRARNRRVEIVIRPHTGA